MQVFLPVFYNLTLHDYDYYHAYLTDYDYGKYIAGIKNAGFEAKVKELSQFFTLATPIKTTEDLIV